MYKQALVQVNNTNMSLISTHNTLRGARSQKAKLDTNGSLAVFSLRTHKIVTILGFKYLVKK